MADSTLSALSAVSSVLGTDEIYVDQSGSKKATVAQLLSYVDENVQADYGNLLNVPSTFTPSTHSHVISDVTGLQTALDGKAASSHTHTASQVTDFSEAVDDRVSTLLVAGSNVTLTYDDASNTLTIAATSGGSGSPGGSDTQVQFNDGGAFGGDSGLTFNKTNKSLTIGGATVTTAATLAGFTQTWNGSGQAFHGVSVDITTTAYDSANSTAIRVRQGTSTKAGIKPTGEIFSVNEFKVASGGATGQPSVVMMDGRFGVNGSSYYGFTSGFSAASNSDLSLYRDAAGFLGVRNTNAPTTACGISVYGTYTSGTNYERVTLTAGATHHKLAAEKGTTGTLRPLVMSYHAMSGAPSATEVPDGCFGVFMDTADSNAIRIWANKGGTLVSATLA